MAATGFGVLNQPPDLSLFDLESVKFNNSGFWASAHVPISSRNSSVHHSDDEDEAAIENAEDFLKHFHSNRQMVLKELPKNATEKDVYDSLTAHQLRPAEVKLSNCSAQIKLQQPEVLETVEQLGVLRVRGQSVSVSVTPTSGLLCVAQLPASWCQQQLFQLAKQHGPVSFVHVLKSPQSGMSRGYGFVMYANRQLALRARALLDGALVPGEERLACDWVDPTRTTIKSLYSKCLHVKNLPEGYKNMREFRQIFSCITNPPYCQIALKNGSPQDWGLVEYSEPRHADLTYDKLQGHVLGSRRLHLSFCMPGVRAIDIFLRVSEQAAAAAANRRAGALLPEPSPPALVHTLSSLQQQNPTFANSLSSIIAGNLAELQQQQQQQQQAVMMATLSQPQLLPALPTTPFLPPAPVDPAAFLPPVTLDPALLGAPVVDPALFGAPISVDPSLYCTAALPQIMLPVPPSIPIIPTTASPQHQQMAPLNSRTKRKLHDIDESTAALSYLQQTLQPTLKRPHF